MDRPSRFAPLRRALVPLMIAGLLGASVPAALAAPPPVPLTMPDALKPGEFDWHPEYARSGPVLIVVSLDDQLAYVYRGGTRIATSTISSGSKGRETPTGVFPILAKEKMHHSNLYDDAPMPFMQRLSWEGVALHAGRIPGHPASHGCIRLPHKFSELLYGITTRGDTVVVMDSASAATLDLASLPADMAQRVFDRPWPSSPVPATWIGARAERGSSMTVGGGGGGGSPRSD
jgi:hypothetical protein